MNSITRGLVTVGSVLAALIITAGTAAGATAVTIDTSNHTVTTSKFVVQFGNATTNPPDDPERIDSIKWTDSSGTRTANLAAEGGGSCGDVREWWGESYGTVIGQPPFLVAGGSTGTWSSPSPNEVQIQSGSSPDPTCSTTRPQIPITTAYTFYDSGPGVNEIRVERRVPFDTHPLSLPGGAGLRVYVPRLPIGVYNTLLYPDAHGDATSAAVCDDCAPVGADVWGGGWFADNSSATNSGVLVLRDRSDQPGAELEPDRDTISAANNTSIVVPQPTGGWTTAIVEVEYLCFYDATTWPIDDRQAGHPATLPSGCGPQPTSGGGGGGGGGGEGGGDTQVQAGFSADSSVRADSLVSFDASGSRVSGASVASYGWSINGTLAAVCGGNTSMLQTRFLSAGTDAVTLRATDGGGVVTSASHTITVSPDSRTRPRAAAARSSICMIPTQQVFTCVHQAGDPISISGGATHLKFCNGGAHVAAGIVDAVGCFFEHYEEIHVNLDYVQDNPPVFSSSVPVNQALDGNPLPDTEREMLLEDVEHYYGKNAFAWICKYGSAELKYKYCAFVPGTGAGPPEPPPRPSADRASRESSPPPTHDRGVEHERARARPAATSPGGIPVSTPGAKNVVLQTPCSNVLGLPDAPGHYEEPVCLDLYVSSLPVQVNGLEYKPAPGAVVVVAPQFNLVISSRAEVDLGSVRLKPAEEINYQLPDSTQGPGDDYPALDVPDIRALLQGQSTDAQREFGSVGGFSTTGGVHVGFGDFSADVTVYAELPPVFTDPNGGPVTVALHGEVSDTTPFRVIYGYVGGLGVDLGPIQLQNFAVCFRAQASSDDNVDPCPRITGIPDDPVGFGDDFWDASGELDAGPVKLVFRPSAAGGGCNSVGRLGIGFSGSAFRFAGAGLETPGIEIAPGVTFDSLYASLTNATTYGKFAGCANFSAGFGLVSLAGTAFAVWTKNGNTYQFDGSELPGLVKSGNPPSYPYTNDFAIGVGGDLGVKFPGLGRVSVGNGYILYADDPRAVFFGGGFNFSVPSGNTYENPPDNGFAIGGGISGAIGLSSFPPPFYLEGEVNTVANVTPPFPFNLTIPVFSGSAGAAISDDPRTGAGGIGLCGPLSLFGSPEITAGVGYHWGDSILDVVFDDLHVGNCDFLPEFRVNVQAADVASASGAGGGSLVRVPRGSPAVDVSLTGTGGSPDVTITGPHGLSATTSGLPADRGVRRGQFLLVRVPELDRTLVFLLHPIAGSYRITPNAGSAPIAELRQADGIQPSVRARVTGRGARRVLTYRIKPEPGQAVAFLDSDAGHVIRLLGRARGTRGTIAFTTQPGHHRRQIVAQILEDRTPVQNITVAGYKPPAPRRLPRVRHVRVRRSGTTATITFSRVPGARAYQVSVTTRDGARQLYRTTRDTLTVRGAIPRGGRPRHGASRRRQRQHTRRPSDERQAHLSDPLPPHQDPPPTTRTAEAQALTIDHTQRQ